MQRDWRDFAALHSGVEGARSAFEKACETLLRKCYPDKNVQQVAVSQGDGGIDIFIGNFGVEPIEVFQCKYFLEQLGPSQKAQIDHSFSTAITNDRFAMSGWTLCVPKTLTLNESDWWADWKRRMEEKHALATDFIKLKTGYELIDMMKEVGVYHHIFQLIDSQLIEEIHRRLTSNHIQVTTHQVQGLLQIDSVSNPNNWKKLARTRYEYPKLLGKENKVDLQLQIFLRCLLPYALMKAYGDAFHKTVLHIIYSEEKSVNKSYFDFISNDTRFIYELSLLLSRQDKEQRDTELASAIHDWFLERRLVFLNFSSVEMTYDPDAKKIETINAPIYEGEDVSNSKILTDYLKIDKQKVWNMQESLGKTLGFLGRLKLCETYCLMNQKVMGVEFELNEDVDLKPNLLRLMCHYMDGETSLDLFRFSTTNSEVWDYVYQPIKVEALDPSPRIEG